MEKISVLLSPPVAFTVVLIVLTVFYLVAGKFSPSVRKSREKLSTYACGENIPGFKFQFGYNLFFIFGLFFTIMHVTALVIATLPAVSPAVYFGIFYLAAIFLCVTGMMFYDEKDSEQFSNTRETGD